MNEFSHIEVRVVRNEEWLKKQHPFYLSESFPIQDFALPDDFIEMTEDDLESLKAWLLPKLFKFLNMKIEQ